MSGGSSRKRRALVLSELCLAIAAMASPDGYAQTSPHPPHSPSVVAGALPYPVYIGAVSGLEELADPSVAARLIETRRIGLYQHAVGMRRLFSTDPAAWRRLLDTWSATSAGGHAMAEEGQVMSLDPAKIGDAFQIFGPARHLPEAVVVNVALGSAEYLSPPGSQIPGKHYQHYVSAADLSAYRIALDTMRRVGARFALVNDTPNFPLADIDNAFARSGYWGNVRASYVYGGGGAFDTPPTYFMQDSATNPYVGERYRRNIAEQIQWLHGHALTSVVIVSPCGPADGRGNICNNAYDPKLLENTRALVTYLKTFGLHHPGSSAMPSAWVVENYPDKVGNTANKPGGPEGLAAVARLLIDMIPSDPAQ